MAFPSNKNIRIIDSIQLFTTSQSALQDIYIIPPPSTEETEAWKQVFPKAIQPAKLDTEARCPELQEDWVIIIECRGF